MYTLVNLTEQPLDSTTFGVEQQREVHFQFFEKHKHLIKVKSSKGWSSRKTFLPTFLNYNFREQKKLSNIFLFPFF